MAAAPLLVEVPDIAVEVEVRTTRKKKAASKANSTKTSSKTVKKRSLRKGEKKDVATAISKAETANLVASVLQQVDNEHHVNFFPQQLEMWENLTPF